VLDSVDCLGDLSVHEQCYRDDEPQQPVHVRYIILREYFVGVCEIPGSRRVPIRDVGCQQRQRPSVDTSTKFRESSFAFEGMVAASQRPTADSVHDHATFGDTGRGGMLVNE
jgi:hypothetical protein